MKQANTKPHKAVIILILGALNTVTPLSIDMYLPAFPLIAKQLNTSIPTVALSVSSYFLGFALGQLLYGPLLDRYGRKKPLYIGLSIYIIACYACIIAPTIELFIVARFLQALSGCVSAVAALAMVRDFFPVNESARIISFMMLILGVSPLLAPTIGSFIITAFSWQYVFVVLSLIALLVLLVTIFILPQPHQPDAGVSLKPKSIISSFLSVLKEPRFYVFSLAGTFAFAGLFVYVAGSPAIFMEGFHTTAKQYGFIFAALSVGFIGGSQLNLWLTKKYSGLHILQVCITIQFIASAVFLVGVIGNWFGLAATLACLFVVLACAGLTYPNAAAIALSSFEKNAGTASALLGFIQIGLGGIISSGVGFIKMRGTLSASLIMSAAALIALTVLLAGKRKLNPEDIAAIKPVAV